MSICPSKVVLYCTIPCLLPLLLPVSCILAFGTHLRLGTITKMLSFFGKGDQKKQPGSGGPVVRRVITKKPIPPKAPISTTSTSTPSRPSTSSSSYKNGSSSAQSNRPKTQLSSIKGKEKASISQSQSRAASSPVKRPVKRKAESARIESESESDSNSDSSGDDATALFGSMKKVKRIGNSSTPRPLAGEELVGKNRTLFQYRSEGDIPEWEGFNPGEEIVRGVRKGWENKGDDEGRVRSLLDKYAACAFLPFSHIYTRVLG